MLERQAGTWPLPTKVYACDDMHSQGYYVQLQLHMYMVTDSEMLVKHLIS